MHLLGIDHLHLLGTDLLLLLGIGLGYLVICWAYFLPDVVMACFFRHFSNGLLTSANEIMCLLDRNPGFTFLASRAVSRGALAGDGRTEIFHSATAQRSKTSQCLFSSVLVISVPEKSSWSVNKSQSVSELLANYKKPRPWIENTRYLKLLIEG